MTTPFRMRAAVALLLLVAFNALAQTTAPAAQPPARVMLLGVFHFDNPGLDAVKYETMDVTQPATQAVLQALSERIARFAPTRVVLEYPQGRDAVINERYAAYRAGGTELGRNEIYQLGFRIAKLAGLPRVHGFDEQVPGGDALWDYMPQQAPAAQQRLQAMVGTLSARLGREQRTLSLRDILIKSNSPEEERENRGFYMAFNGVAADKRLFHGADMAAGWWHRNLRMYANVQLLATPGERVVVIAGSGHTAVLRNFLRDDADRAEENVLPYL